MELRMWKCVRVVGVDVVIVRRKVDGAGGSVGFVSVARVSRSQTRSLDQQLLEECAVVPASDAQANQRSDSSPSLACNLGTLSLRFGLLIFPRNSLALCLQPALFPRVTLLI